MEPSRKSRNTNFFKAKGRYSLYQAQFHKTYRKGNLRQHR